MLFLDDPYSTTDIGNMFDNYFLGFYTAEMSLKILALGFFWNEGSYLRNGWNILDFFIVVTGLIPLVINSNSVRLSGLRTLRVLRPLKTISSLKHLKLILMSLFSAMPMIMNAAFLLFFCLLIYAIAAIQLFPGTLKKRCFDKQTGLLIFQNFDTSYMGYLCGWDTCPQPDQYICGKQIATPNSSITSFDTLPWSLLMMFQEITLENWSINMYYVARTFNYYIVFFFVSLAFLGAMIFLNLFASIITQAYQEQIKEVSSKINDMKNEKKAVPFELEDIQVLKLCEKTHHKRMERRRNATNNYGATENWVYTPKTDEIRWQDILDLKLNRLLEERKKTLKPVLSKETQASEINELLNTLDDLLISDKNDKSDTNNVKSILKKNFETRKNNKSDYHNAKIEQNKIVPIITNKISPFNNIDKQVINNENESHHLDKKNSNEEILKILNKSKTQESQEKTNIDKPENQENDISMTKFEKELKKTDINTSDINHINNIKDLKPEIHKIILNEKEELFSKSLEKHTFSKSLNKFKLLSSFFTNKSNSFKNTKLDPSLKIIEYMLMVDYEQTYESNSQKDVMINAESRKKINDAIQLENKLKNTKCRIQYLKNNIDISELHDKHVRNQTRIMTHLPAFGEKANNRLKDPILLKKILYGKNNNTNRIRVPIGGIDNDLIRRKWFKNIENMKKSERLQSSLHILTKKTKKHKKKARQAKKEKTQLFQYFDLNVLINEPIFALKEEEILKNFTNEDDYLAIKVFFYLHIYRIFIKNFIFRKMIIHGN